MSALGHKRTLKRLQPISALPPIADINPLASDFRFVPKADIAAEGSAVRGFLTEAQLAAL
jgi:hypothetical protein